MSKKNTVVQRVQSAVARAGSKRESTPPRLPTMVWTLMPVQRKKKQKSREKARSYGTVLHFFRCKGKKERTMVIGVDWCL
jgi:hypothetical protein